jgi:hypothetical protein
MKDSVTLVSNNEEYSMESVTGGESKLQLEKCRIFYGSRNLNDVECVPALVQLTNSTPYSCPVG